MTSRRGSMVAIFLLMGAAMVGWPSGLRSQTEKPDGLPWRTAIPDKAKSLSAADEAGIRKTINGIEAAWNAHDMDAYAGLLRPDVEWVNVVGMHWRGRDAVMLAHRVFHKTTFKNHNIRTPTTSTCTRCALATRSR